MGGKGSSPRPFSVDRQTFESNWDAIFSKNKKESEKTNMQIRADQITEGGSPCGCGRSPTGKCIGWHGLTEEQYVAKRNEYELAKYVQDAQNIWNDSCTSNREQ